MLGWLRNLVYGTAGYGGGFIPPPQPQGDSMAYGPFDAYDAYDAHDNPFLSAAAAICQVN